MKIIKHALRSLGMYEAARSAYYVARSLGRVRLDASPVRETIELVRGGQDLPTGNYRFYRNFADGVAARTRATGAQFLYLDVGANSGWFAKTVLRFTPDARIVSYEPLKSQHPFLGELRRRYPTFEYRGFGLGEAPGTLTIKEYGTSGLSSLKPLSDNYRYAAHYDVSVVNSYPVEIRTLDGEIPGIIAAQPDRDRIELVLKIDTQGFEYEVLAGARESLKSGRIRFVVIELMTVEKYSGGRLYPEITDLLHGYGFRLWDLNTQHYESKTRQMSEFDAIFVLDP